MILKKLLGFLLARLIKLQILFRTINACFSYGDKQKQMHGTIIKKCTEIKISFISTYTKLHYSFIKEQQE